MEKSDLIACAGGNQEGLLGNESGEISIFFYPIEGAYDFRYYESESPEEAMQFSNYHQIHLQDEPVFNGYLRKFVRDQPSSDNVGIVTYRTEDSLHICNPIQLKSIAKQTEFNNELLTINNNSINPQFQWNDGIIDENAIYFQVISDQDGNLISGTYTFENNFTFYDLSNVVLNIRDIQPHPTLSPNQTYHFTLMGVSEDNWVNLVFNQSFETN